MARDSSKRTRNLIAEFSNGYAKGWFIPVKECFKRELDIRYTARTKKRETYFEWTQGPYYCFSAGQVLYQSNKAYTLWSEGVKLTDFAIQIVEATPNSPKFSHDSESIGGVNYGFVRFVLYISKKNELSLTSFSCYTLSQNEFVNFLKYGEIENEKIFLHG